MADSQVSAFPEPDRSTDPGATNSALPGSSREIAPRLSESSPEVSRAPTLRWLGRVDYEPTWRAMQEFNDARDATTRDQIWFLEHPPVFTLGMNAKREHLLAPGEIPVVQIDRGGQVTYHGPGQLVVYPLLDVRRLGLGVRQLVVALENAVISMVAEHDVHAVSRREAPGIYVDGRKLASIGLRIRRGCSYHGMAFNVAMDLEPFQRINPCGYSGLEVTDLTSLGVVSSGKPGESKPGESKAVATVSRMLAPHLLRELGLPAKAEWI
ncbi:MAG TPA: lipoyl(octanoyl) transferase LipB [Steroidobacteraceae bacterium]|jgi:lipoyl(octanoyl) transferase